MTIEEGARRLGLALEWADGQHGSQGTPCGWEAFGSWLGRALTLGSSRCCFATAATRCLGTSATRRSLPRLHCRHEPRRASSEAHV